MKRSKHSRASHAVQVVDRIAHNAPLRDELRGAARHGTALGRAAARRGGRDASILADPELRGHAADLARSLERAFSRLATRRSHRLRTTLLTLGSAVAAGAIVVGAKNAFAGR